MTDIGEFEQSYEATCECGTLYKIVTQKDNKPEYYTSIDIICECGERVRFDLPVN